MGAGSSSLQRDGAEPEEDASSLQKSSTEPDAMQEESSIFDATKPLQKNGQISSMNSLNGLTDASLLAEVGQPDGVSVVQSEDAPETMDSAVTKDETAPHANGEKADNEPADAQDISIVEEKVCEEKQQEEANEVGFKKIFRFVGFKFTLKKDKNEEKDPVKLLKVKEKDGDAVEDAAAEKVAEEPAEVTTVTEEKEEETKAATPVGDDAEDTDKTEVPAEGAAADAVDETSKEEAVEKESNPPSQEATQSSFRKLLSGGLFSNLRKKASNKKTKEEEEKEKETTAEEEIKEGDETAEVQKEEGEEAKVEAETKEETPATTTEEAKPEPTAEAEGNNETPAPAEDNAEEEKPEAAEEEKLTTETELLSSQEKVKTHGSPLKKLFNGAGLKKLATKKNKSKKEAEAKLTESTEQAAELQTATESEEAPKAESGPSSPEDSGEHAVDGEASTIESSQETEGEVTSDGEKKKEGIIPWSSFKKLVTPKKRVKKSSESDEEAAAEKAAKSATLSSTESAVFEEKANEEEPKEEVATEEEPNTETTEKLVSSTEEPKKKMDTSVSWEALMCMGGPKKRTRKTSDSDEEDETKLEEEPTPAVAEEEQEAKVEESPIVTSTETEPEEEVLPVDAANQTEKESAWDTLKRFVFAKNKPKQEEKAEDSPEQGNSDGEVQKEESSFSLRKLFPGRKKKKADQQASGEGGSGEEDSDTPAVVPLSEYDTEQTETKQEEVSEPAITQAQASVEERAPSWIAAIVEDGDGKHDQLSDIPEEADNAATPKSADTTIEEEDEEHPSLPPTTRATSQRRMSLAEEKPLVPAVSIVTTPVPTGPEPEVAEMVLEAAVEQISEAPCQTSVTVEDLPVEEASVGTEEEFAIEHAELKKNTILEPHNSEEAMAICTGLGTKDIAKVAVEKPVTSTSECLTVISDSLCTEVALEEMPADIEVAVATEDSISEAQVQQVEATELESSIEFPSDIPEVETATKCEEPETEQTALIACRPEQSEIVKAAELDEDTPEVVNLMAPTMETNVSMEIVEITHPAVEMKEEVVELDQFVAVGENTPVQEVVQVVSQQSITIENISTENIIVEYSPCVDLEEVEIKADLEVSDEEIIEEVLVKEADTPVQTVLGVTMLETCNNLSEEDGQETEAHVIEEQSIVIARGVIETAMDQVLEAQTEAPKPATPPPTEEESSTPVQALLSTEEAIEENTEKPIITEPPVALICSAPKVSITQSPMVLCSAIQVTDVVSVEEAESLDGPAGIEQEPTAELQQAMEVNTTASEELIEEVVELESEILPAEEPKEAKNEESKEEVEATPCPAVHMPVMVVLQSATVVEDTPLEEEAVEEFGNNGPAVVQNQDAEPKCEEAVGAALPTLPEEPQTPAVSTEVAAPDQEVPASAADTKEEEERAVAAERCAEVMAQVNEMIEEAVKEIEPISSEITAAS